MKALLHRCLGLGLFVLACSQASASPACHSYGDGMPLPWPFPWARECPVDWDGMQGRYTLFSETEAAEQIELKISVIAKANYKMLRVSHFGPDGALLSEGFTYVGHGQQVIRLWLNPVDPQGTPTWAVLKLYYRTANPVCEEDMLVPILTLEHLNDPQHAMSQYRLERLN